MLKMMTYKEANPILVSALIPDERCIAKGIGKDNGADWEDTQDHVSAMTTFINRNGGIEKFPDSRLMPVEAIVNGAPFKTCGYPLDDKLMDLGTSSSTGDAGALGYTYEVVDIIYGSEITNDSQKWLTVIPNTYDPNDSTFVISNLWDPLTTTYSPAVRYENTRVDDAAFMATRHEAKVRYRCTKNNYFDENSSTQMKNACETFVVTVQCGNNNSQYDAQFTGATDKKLIVSPNYSGTNGAVCEYAVEVSGVDAYWTSNGVVGDVSFSDMVTVSSGGITIDFSKIGQEQGTGNITFTVYGNWTGNNASSPTGLPVVPTRSSNSITFGVSINGANEPGLTFKSKVESSGNLNMQNATKEEINTRCSNVMTIVYNRSDGTVNITKGNGGGISPVLYPKTASDGSTTQNFTWLDEGITSRRYSALAVNRAIVTIDVLSTDTYTVEKTDSSDQGDYNISISGNSFTIDFRSVPAEPETKRFRIKHSGSSSEFADIAFTLN